MLLDKSPEGGDLGTEFPVYQVAPVTPEILDPPQGIAREGGQLPGRVERRRHGGARWVHIVLVEETEHELTCPYNSGRPSRRAVIALDVRLRNPVDKTERVDVAFRPAPRLDRDSGQPATGSFDLGDQRANQLLDLGLVDGVDHKEQVDRRRLWPAQLPTRGSARPSITEHPGTRRDPTDKLWRKGQQHFVRRS